MAASEEKLYDMFPAGTLRLVRKKGIRHIRLSVSLKKGITLSCPWHMPESDAISFAESRKEWIVRTIARQEKELKKAMESGKCIESLPGKKETAELRRKAAGQLLPLICRAASEHGFRYGKVSFRNNRSNWGSCSSKGNININIKTVLLPEHLQEYIILHELCHLKYLNHGKRFHALLDRLCSGREAELSKELKEWKLL
ncbi:MAG TPA: DUF45 domain-containing protein [Candidatus Coprenecus stercoripullorum]|nr:DUF45 domain-containing protein [Candidatus Coprenecus stercoripullorum]